MVSHKSTFTAWSTASKMALAACLAFVLSLYFKLPMSVWSLVTIAAVTQVGLTQTLTKSLMRAIGTILGALIGYGIVKMGSAHAAVILFLVSLMIFITSALSLQKTIYSYAGIVMGMTIAIIVFFSFGQQNIDGIAFYRTIEVLLGVCILGVVNFGIYAYVKKCHPHRLSRKTISWKLPQLSQAKNYLLPSLRVTLACLVTFLIWRVFKQPQGYWSTLTCLLIMEEDHAATIKKGLFRFFAHLIAAAFGALAVVALLHTSYAWKLLPLLVSFFFCGYLLGAENKYSSMGNTIAIAVSIMLLSSTLETESLQIVLARFYNVVIGIAAAYFFLLIKTRHTHLKQSSHEA